MAIVMMPIGSRHSASVDDWYRTVTSLSEYEKFPSLTKDQFWWLRSLFPDGCAPFWGTSLPSQAPQPGDTVWFHHEGRVQYVADVRVSFTNEEFAKELWRESEAWNKTGGWSHIFAPENLRRARINKADINNLLGHKPGDRWQGARRLGQDQSKLLQSRIVLTLDMET